MKSILTPLVAIAIATSLHGAALAEYNAADNTIQTADGSFTSRNMTLQRDFKLELMYLPPAATQGHWVPLTWDTKGRMIAASYDTDHLLRLTIPNVGQPGNIQVENVMEGVGGAEGLLVAFNALYMNVNRSPTARHGVYKLTDTNNDDKYDKREFLWSFQGSGDHGDHQLRLMPGGQRIIGIFGNDTPPTIFNSSRVPMIWNEDQLLPRMDDRGVGGHAAGRFRPGGQTISFKPDGSDIRLETMGYRNPVDFAYNKDGELFVYDSDLEYDKAQPWYRPTRLTHHISGGDYGWAHGNGKMPQYYIDTFGVVAPIGSGSPVGAIAGTGFKAPARYQDGMFLDDWSYGNVYFVDMKPQGSSYTGKAELFTSGNPFAVSGITVNPNDGSLWFATTGTQLYRVTYTGTGNIEPTKPDTTMAAMRKERQAMEDLHGRKAPGSINAIFAELNNPDRGIRYAARVALEWQDPALWTTRALDERDARRAIAALVALTRVSGTDIEHRANLKKPAPDHALQNRILTALDKISWSDLGYQDKLDLMRAYHLAFIRFGEEDTSAAGGAQQQLYGVRNKLKLPDEAIRQRLISKFNPMFPTEFRELNWEMGELVSYLEPADFVEKAMAQLKKAAPTPTYFPIEEWVNPQQRQRGTPGTLGGLSNAFIQTQEDQWKYAELLRTVDVGWTPAAHQDYLRWFRTASATQQGGASFQGYLSFMHAKHLLKMTDADKAAIEDKTVLEAPVAGAGGGGGRGGGGGAGAAGGGRGGAAGVGRAGGAAGGAAPQATPGGNL